MTIRTQWHKIQELIDADEVYFTSPPEPDGRAVDVQEFGVKLPHVSEFYKTIGQEAPKFFIDSDLMEISNKSDFHKSLIDMKRAGVLRLPYPLMVVEFANNSVHYIVTLRDLQYKEVFKTFEHPSMAKEFAAREFPFYGAVARIQKDEQGQYLILGPGVHFIDIVEKEDGTPWLNATTTATGFTPNTPEINALVEKVNIKDAAPIYRAWYAAMLLMSTAGVEREVIETERLNKRRKADGKTIIPKHSYIYIGRVYKRAAGEESEDYIPRRSPRPHWRRGHTRTVRIGAGRTGSKLRYIPPRLVAFKGDTDVPAIRDYEVKV